jgi:hypothetical protein
MRYYGKTKSHSFISGFSFKFHRRFTYGPPKLACQVAVSVLEAGGGCYCLVQLDLPFVEKSLKSGVFLKRPQCSVK